MRKVSAILITVLPLGAAVSACAEDIILRLRPDANAPIITKITATEKVLLDAAPVDEDSDWRQLDLKVPFDGYVPAASLTKNFAIVEGTPVHFLPDAKSEIIASARDGDLYEVKRVKEEWATIQYTEKLRTYFRTDASVSTPASPLREPAGKASALDLAVSAPTHSPEPDASEFDPDLAVGQTSPEDLPPENVVWKSGAGKPAASRAPQAKTNADQVSSPERPDSIMVSPLQTQAREAGSQEKLPTDQPLRLLVGTLVRKIETAGPDYSIRLRSSAGRLIAYVDFSAYYIEDIGPYLNERVYLRGHLAPLRSDSNELVILVQDIQIAP